MAMVIKTEAEVIRKIIHSKDIAEIQLKPGKKISNFKPGQFLHLALDPYDQILDWPESRVFSIMNSPSQRDTITLVVSAKGEFTQRIVTDLKETDKVWIKLPYGEFSIEETENPVVLIAGGTGISPFLSYLDYCLDNEIPNLIRLYYGVREESLLLFQDKLTAYSSLKNFKQFIFVEKNKNTNSLQGKIDIAKVYHDNPHGIFYLSGPWAMISKFRDYLLEQKVEMNRIKIDEW